jgi:CHASE2 domain-containing sensor protein
VRIDWNSHLDHARLSKGLLLYDDSGFLPDIERPEFADTTMNRAAISSCFWFFYRWAAYMLVAYALVNFDLFGLASLSRTLSQDAFNRLFDPLSERQALVAERATDPASSSADGAISGASQVASDGRDIAVVLLGDNALDALGWNWPTPFSNHALVLNTILEHEPAAVMVDFLFPEERGPPVMLRESIADYQDSGTPLYFAEIPGRFPPITESLWSAFTKEVDNGTKPRFVPVPSLVEYGVVREYPAVDKEGKTTAAFQIYNDLLRHKPPYAALQERQPIEDDRPLTLLWPVDIPDLNKVYMKCPKIGFWDKVLPGLKYGEHHADSERGVFEQCPTYSTIPVELLLTSHFDPNKHAQVREYLRNRIVFYGASITGASDIAFTATHGRLPGVYLHAAALDNLIALGRKYKSTESGHLLTEIRLNFECLQIALLALLIFGMLMFRHLLRDVTNSDTVFYAITTFDGFIFVRVRAILWILFEVTAALFVGACTAIAYFWLDFAPVNGFGLLALLLLVLGLHDRFDVRIIVEATPFHISKLSIGMIRRLGAAWSKGRESLSKRFRDSWRRRRPR